MSKMKSVVGLAVGVTLFGSLLVGCDSGTEKETKDAKVSVEKKAVGLDKTTDVKKVVSVPLMTTVVDGGDYSLSYDGVDKTGERNFLLTYKNTLKKKVTFTYPDNKRVSFVLVDDKGKTVVEKDVTVKGDFETAEDVAKDSTFAYEIGVGDIPDGVYTLNLTHLGKSDDVKTDVLVLPGITFKGKDVSVTVVSKKDREVKKVYKKRPEESKKEVKEIPDSVKTTDKDVKLPDTKVSEGVKKPVSTEKPKEIVRKKKEETKKVSAIKSDVVFNGWADSHSVEVMLGDSPAVFQVDDKALDQVGKLKAGDKVSFVFTQNGLTRTVLSVMK